MREGWEGGRERGEGEGCGNEREEEGRGGDVVRSWLQGVGKVLPSPVWSSPRHGDRWQVLRDAA